MLVFLQGCIFVTIPLKTAKLGAKGQRLNVPVFYYNVIPTVGLTYFSKHTLIHLCGIYCCMWSCSVLTKDH